MKHVFVAALLMFTISVCMQAKDRVWQTGKVTEISNDRFGVGNSGKMGWALGQPHATHDKGVSYTVQTADYTYIATEMSMAHHRLKEERVKVNDEVKFALQGETKFILLGDDGKERTLQLMKRSTRTHDDQAKP